MDSKPLISVIVPVYNVENYLTRCVDSIRRQTYQNLEIILIDDGSTDNSGNLCEELALRDDRICVIHQENCGQAKARNAGLDAATGELVGFVDSDDYILPKMYERLYDLMVSYDADISCCNHECRGMEGHTGYNSEELNELSIFSPREGLKLLFSNYKVIYGVWNKLYRRDDFWDEYRFKPMIYEDADATAQCISKAWKIVYTGEPLYVYWCNEFSTTRARFTGKQFDELESRLLVVPVYERICPDLVNKVKASYIHVGLKLLRKSAADKVFYQDRRQDLYCKVKEYLKENPRLPLTRKDKLQLLILRMGLGCFDSFIDVLTRLRRWIGRA